MKWLLRIAAAVAGGLLLCFFGVSSYLLYGSTMTAGECKKQYPAQEQAMVPVYNLKQQQKIRISFAVDYGTMKYSAIPDSEYVTIHTDATAKEESRVSCYSWLKRTKSGSEIVLAPVEPVLATQMLKQESSQYTIDDISPDEDITTYWGAAPIYYICIHYDPDAKTLQKRKKPVIIPFTVASETKAPEITGTVDEKGCLCLQWKPVAGATSYRVYQYMENGNFIGSNNKPMQGALTGYRTGSFFFLDTVKNTKYNRFGAGKRAPAPSSSGVYKEVIQNSGLEGTFFVTAVADGVESNLSAPIDTSDLKLPYKVVTEDAPIGYYEGMEELPDTVRVTAIDGSQSVYQLSYTLAARRGNQLQYDYQVVGTMLGGAVTVWYKEDKKPLSYMGPEKRETVLENANISLRKQPSMAVQCVAAQKVKANAGTLYEMVKKRTKQLVKKGDSDRVWISAHSYAVTADSAEEAWLAYNMMNGETAISLAAFPSLQNPYILEDVFAKVYLNNPYIMGVTGYDYDDAKQTLRIQYRIGKWQLRYRQWRMQQVAEKIAEKLRKEEKDPEKRERNLYRWMTENIQYDTGLEKNIKKHKFQKQKRQSQIELASGAYGALVRRKALCQGYASAFQLIGTMAGLEVRTVDGYINGNVPHAWNLVRLQNNWYQVDCSNNTKTTGVAYFLYNASAQQATQTGYTRKNNYILEQDRNQMEKQMQDGSKEYYASQHLEARNQKQVEQLVNAWLTEQEKTKTSHALVFRCSKKLSQKTVLAAVRSTFLKRNMGKELEKLSYEHKNNYFQLKICNLLAS